MFTAVFSQKVYFCPLFKSSSILSHSFISIFGTFFQSLFFVFSLEKKFEILKPYKNYSHQTFFSTFINLLLKWQDLSAYKTFYHLQTNMFSFLRFTIKGKHLRNPWPFRCCLFPIMCFYKYRKSNPICLFFDSFQLCLERFLSILV